MLAIVFRDRELRGRFLGMSRHQSWVYRFIERNAPVQCGVYRVWLCEEGLSVTSVVELTLCIQHVVDKVVHRKEADTKIVVEHASPIHVIGSVA